MGKNLIDLLKKDRPSISPDVLGAIGVPSMNNASDSDLGFREFLRRLMFSAGLNHIVQVNDCETDSDFTESDNGVFDIASAASTGKRVGTNNMKLSSTGTCDGTQFVTSLLVNESAVIPVDGISQSKQMSWEDTDFLGFWVHNEVNGDYSTAGEMKVTIVNAGVEQSQVNIQALVDSVHKWFEVDMNAEGWDRDRVESIRFYANVASGEDLYIDDIIRYLNSYNNAPYYGNSFPIKASTALVDNDQVKWTIDGLIKSSSSAAIGDLGFVKIFEDETGGTVTGDGARSKWGTIPGLSIGIARVSAATTAGDYLEWSANTTLVDVTAAATEKGVAIALEAAGAANDDIFVLFRKAGAAD